MNSEQISKQLEKSDIKTGQINMTAQGGWRNWLPFVLGLLLAIAGLDYIRSNAITKLDEAALGRDTQNVFAKVNGLEIHCLDARDAGGCYQSYITAGRPPAILWLGNSQLAAINRVKSGDQTASTILHKRLLTRGYFLSTFSQPNANLLEHAVAFSVLSRKFDTRLLVLPVFLDDMREQGIRRSVADFIADQDDLENLQQSGIWPLVSPNLKAQNIADNLSKKPQTLQTRVEDWLNRELGSRSKLWESRLQIKGFASSSLHYFRNKILGINSSTKRKVDDNVYRAKLKVLEAVLVEAKVRKIKVLLYIPPYRNDIEGPYVAADYTRLKRDVEALAKQFDARFANIETTVPGPQWATVVHPVYGFEDDDFMHFTAAGHQRLATSLGNILKEMGF